MFFSAVWYAKSCTCGITFVDINVSQTYAEELGFLYEQGCGCKMPYVELERGVGGSILWNDERVGLDGGTWNRQDLKIANPKFC